MSKVPDNFQNLIADETRAFAVLHTLRADKSPLMTLMWFSMDGDDFLFNSVPNSLKHKNMSQNPSVHFVIFDPQNMYRYLEISGRVIEITQAGALEHNNILARKYDWDDGTFGRNRSVYRVRADKVRAVE